MTKRYSRDMSLTVSYKVTIQQDDDVTKDLPQKFIDDVCEQLREQIQDEETHFGEMPDKENVVYVNYNVIEDVSEGIELFIDFKRKKDGDERHGYFTISGWRYEK